MIWWRRLGIWCCDLLLGGAIVEFRMGFERLLQPKACGALLWPSPRVFWAGETLSHCYRPFLQDFFYGRDCGFQFLIGVVEMGGHADSGFGSPVHQDVALQ